MNLDRACEILQSKEVYDVYYNGTPVWIDSIDVKRGAASIHEGEDAGNKKEVPVEELKETQH